MTTVTRKTRFSVSESKKESMVANIRKQMGAYGITFDDLMRDGPIAPPEIGTGAVITVRNSEDIPVSVQKITLRNENEWKNGIRKLPCDIRQVKEYISQTTRLSDLFTSKNEENLYCVTGNTHGTWYTVRIELWQ